MYMYMHIYIDEKLFSETQSMTLALALQPHFIGKTLIASWNKALHTYMIGELWKLGDWATEGSWPFAVSEAPAWFTGYI